MSNVLLSRIYHIHIYFYFIILTCNLSRIRNFIENVTEANFRIMMISHLYDSKDRVSCCSSLS